MRESSFLFLAFSALGLYQAAPSVTTGDAGEFAAAAATWGVPHAPGYPAWTVLAKALGTALPSGDWAYRCNLLSALCGALALAILADALKRGGFPRAYVARTEAQSAEWRRNFVRTFVERDLPLGGVVMRRGPVSHH